MILTFVRYPKHIILDVTKPISTNMDIYWPYRYSSTLSRDDYFNSSLNIKGNFPQALRARPALKRSTVFLITPDSFEAPNASQSSTTSNPNTLVRLFDTNFLKREKLYTKLKYSRSPAYDIVSGGVAALFSGFIGFLISEKFGIELVDSGDFYTFFMYLVFLGFSCRPLLKVIDKGASSWMFVSPKFLLSYLYTVITLLCRAIQSLHLFRRTQALVQYVSLSYLGVQRVQPLSLVSTLRKIVVSSFQHLTCNAVSLNLLLNRPVLVTLLLCFVLGWAFGWMF